MAGHIEKTMIKALFQKTIVLCTLAFLGGGLSACTEIQFLSAQWKEYNGPPGQSAGLFKVGKPYSVQGTVYRPSETYSLDETGIASWYGPGFHAKKTANGERFDENELTAAHRTLQLPSLVRVTNLENGKSLVVRVNDRGPFSRGRIIDVSKRAADLLGFKNKGTARVRVQVLAEESRQMADAAKAGRDTRGMELALNQQVPTGDNTRQSAGMMAPPPVSGYQTASVTSEPLSPVSSSGSSRVYSPSGVQGHVARSGHFYPDPVVKQFPVVPTALYVQVGSFGNHDNAIRASQTLYGLGPVRIMPVSVNGRSFFRVQVGPLQSVQSADSLLSQVVNRGYPEAHITVDNSS